MLERIIIDDAVRALRPDFAVLLMTAEGLVNAPPTGDVVRTGDLAEPAAQHVEAWREAYRGFGVNPRRARPSVDALLRRAELPGINRVVDAYNAISVRHGLPIGGEDLDAYDGPASRPGWSGRAATNRSPRSRTASRSSSVPSPARSSGATTPASRAAAGTGASAPAPTSPSGPRTRCSSSNAWSRTRWTVSPPPATNWPRCCARSPLA
jgi:hypothetical protein